MTDTPLRSSDEEINQILDQALGSEPNRPTQRDKITQALQDAGVHMWRDSHGNAYASLPHDGGGWQRYAVQSHGFRQVMKLIYGRANATLDSKGKRKLGSAPAQAFQDAIGMLEATALEAEIREHVAKLDKRYHRLIGCRVSVEALHNRHRTGNVYDVHIVLSVPGRDLAVSREPHKAKEQYANPDVHTSIRDAFRAAERQLQSWKEMLREDTAAPSASACWWSTTTTSCTGGSG